MTSFYKFRRGYGLKGLRKDQRVSDVQSVSKPEAVYAKNTLNSCDMMFNVYSQFNCGVGEIRTRGTLLAHTRFPGVPLQPLEHHSFGLRVQSYAFFLKYGNFVWIYLLILQ